MGECDQVLCRELRGAEVCRWLRGNLTFEVDYHIGESEVGVKCKWIGCEMKRVQDVFKMHRIICYQSVRVGLISQSGL